MRIDSRESVVKLFNINSIGVFSQFSGNDTFREFPALASHT